MCNMTPNCLLLFIILYFSVCIWTVLRWFVWERQAGRQTDMNRSKQTDVAKWRCKRQRREWRECRWVCFGWKTSEDHVLLLWNRCVSLPQGQVQRPWTEMQGHSGGMGIRLRNLIFPYFIDTCILFTATSIVCLQKLSVRLSARLLAGKSLSQFAWIKLLFH